MCKGLATLPTTCMKSAKDIKHKIKSLIHKHDPQATDQKQIKEKTAAAAKSIPTPAEVKKWKESFSHVMSSQTGRRVFTNFLRSEFSKENMDFWVACEDYKKCEPSKLVKKAKQLYKKHVEADAPNEVNLDEMTREGTKWNLENTCPFCFNDAQKMIYTLMERDSYRRFLTSKLIQDLSQTQSTAAQKQKEIKNWANNRKVLNNS
ncbi:regulator of G-protein signaling 4-like [Anoplopoma fimbria]|uniref:regulator of G-protein signaling 4-like n=1 Tax=Anoplopoma fimbria TaxID=229290 RepID=UPI0023EC42DD|nr:regulator of G-protein signaling 4-like [Anoplopoma fimbria]